MNFADVSRRVEALNRILASELGKRPLYAWQHSATLESFVAEEREDGSLVYDYVCGCGINKVVHTAHCKTLSVAAARPFRVNLAPNHPDAWIVCSLQFPVPEEAFRRQWGCLMPYPRNGVWVPTGISGGTAALPRGIEPDLAATWDFIHMARESRSANPTDLSDATEARQRKVWAQYEETAEYAFRDAMGRGNIAGTKGHVSYASVESKNQKGLSCQLQPQLIQ